MKIPTSEMEKLIEKAMVTNHNMVVKCGSKSYEGEIVSNNTHSIGMMVRGYGKTPGEKLVRGVTSVSVVTIFKSKIDDIVLTEDVV